MSVASVVEVVSPFSLVIEPTQGAVIDITSTAEPVISTRTKDTVVEIQGPPVVQNAIVSTTPPSNPYEGMVWVDIS